jgi:hypothetical protein
MAQMSARRTDKAATTVYGWVYAAKFLCGYQHPASPAEQGPVEGGRYATAINVHNPNRHTVGFVKKAVLLFDASRPHEAAEQPLPPLKPLKGELAPGYGLEIDCRDIREVLLRGAVGPGEPSFSFIKGWVVIETAADAPLDIVVVYTAGSLSAPVDEAPSIAVDRVTGRVSRRR